jgi:hypothetical protein
MTGVTWPDNWVINLHPVTPSSTPRPPPWVYKSTQDLVECAVHWQIYYWHLLLLLQPQQHASAEVSLQPDSPAHRHSLSTTPAWVHSYRWLLPESLSLCVVRADYKLSSPVPTRTLSILELSLSLRDLCSTDLGSPLDPGQSCQQVKGNLSSTTFELFNLISGGSLHCIHHRLSIRM